MKCLRVLMAKTKNVQTMGLIAGLAAFLMVWMSAPVYGHEYRTDALIVKYKAGVTQAQTQAVNTKHKVITQENINRISAQSVTVNDLMPVELKIQELKSDPNVEYAEPDFQRSVSVTSPNDSYYYSYQWNMPKIRADYAWDSQRGSSNVIIAIVDTGVSLNHPDLSGKIVAGYDSVSHDGNPTDENGHGTHVAGIAAATTNNGVGVAGVSWNSRIMPVRVLDASGNGWDSDIAEGIIWAADNGAKVINMSLGGTSSYPQTLQNAVNYAYARGVTIAAAAGNNPNGEIIYPAACANVIGVAATDSNDNRAIFSNYGSFVDVAAPGVLVASTYWTAVSGNVYGTGSGTSMATPHVAGLAALVLAQNPSWTPDWVEQVIESSAVDLGSPGRDDFYGYGRIDAYSVITALAAVNHIEITAGTNQTAGSAFSVTATAKDGTDNTMTGYNGSLVIRNTSFTVSPTSGNFSAGVWTGNVTITKAGTDYITADSGGGFGQSAAITVNPGPLNHIDVTPPSATVYYNTSQSFSAQGEDICHNNIIGLTYNWSGASGTRNPATGRSTTYTAPLSGSSDILTVTAGGKSTNVSITLTSIPPTNRGYIISLYRTLLQRGPTWLPPNDSEIGPWVNALNNGSFSREGIAYAMMTSHEYHMRMVREMYDVVLGRSAEVGEQHLWANGMDAGLTLRSMRAQIYGSGEFALTYPDNYAYVNFLYTKILNRSAADPGAQGWVMALNNGSMSRSQAAYAIMCSDEYYMGYITLKYLDIMGRAPEPAGLVAWLGGMRNGMTEEVLPAQLYGSYEYFVTHAAI